MKARDEYIQRVPPERDKQNHGADYAFYAADQYYLYGHFDQAEPRFEAIYKERCGKDSLGYEAWKRLIVMSNLQKNAERSRELAEAEKKSSCAKTDLQMAEEKRGDLTDLVLQNAAFDDANKVFEQAKAAPPGPAKDALWRKAGAMYEAALTAAPSHKDAPAAAINSAFCYKQVGEFDKAIKLYQLFIDNYGSEDILNRLQNGGMDPEKQAKVGPDPAEYKERIKYLGMAYDALSTTYYGFFAYQHAAESFGKVASNPRFDDTERANSARIAMVLYSNLGDRANMNRMYGILVDPKMHLAVRQARRGRLPPGQLRLRAVEPGVRRVRRQLVGARPGDRQPRAVPLGEQGPAGVGALRARVGVPDREDDAVRRATRRSAPGSRRRSRTGSTSSRTRRRWRAPAARPGGASPRATRRTRTTAARPTTRSSTSRSRASSTTPAATTTTPATSST